MQTSTPIIERPIPLEANHELLRLPVQSFIDPPEQGHKTKVSLHSQRGALTLNGFLHKIISDPVSITGQRALVEISTKQLHKLKKESGPWLLYPSTFNPQKRKEHSYEILL